MAAKQIEY